MNILLVNPKTPPTFHSFKYALKFIRKTISPPLGLLTVSSMLPHDWNRKLVDMNIEDLNTDDIRWADYVFITGMDIQIDYFREVLAMCKQEGTKIVAGGPMVTFEHENFPEVDHFILNEAEITLPEFLDDLEEGNPKRIYSSNRFPDISETPIPDWDLLNKKKYYMMNVQYSRGCPYNCEFCSITALNGRKPRTKNTDQFLAELDSLLKKGWKGAIFIVDDNFIGNRNKLKKDTLPALVEWSRKNHYPFTFSTEVSINLADDQELIDLMVEAGFKTIFVGIETPNEESLKECGKFHNMNRDMLESVRTLQGNGLIVTAGFIVGFDNDTEAVFEQQENFIQRSGIISAMVGLLKAPHGSRLYERLRREGRLLGRNSGNNMDGAMNFLPRMDSEKLMQGYKNLLESLYSHKHYYERIKRFIRDYKPQLRLRHGIDMNDILGFFRSVWTLGIREKGRLYFWKTLFYSLFTKPKSVPTMVVYAAYGYHFRKIVSSL